LPDARDRSRRDGGAVPFSLGRTHGRPRAGNLQFDEAQTSSTPDLSPSPTGQTARWF
jgi:hypothetical protein